jgi:multiple sugar transport system substrate-binding protein
MNIKEIDKPLLYLGLGLIIVSVVVAIIAGNINRVNRSQRVNLVFTQWWEDELEGDVMQTLIREFEAANPRITISLDTRPYGEIQQSFVNGTAADQTTSAPDLLALDPRWLDTLVQNQFLENLDQFREQTESPIFPVENAWALPMVVFVEPLFYNIELLQSAGFDRPPKNRSELLAYARAINNPSAGRFGLALSLSPGEPQGIQRNICSWIWASGTAILNDGVPRFNTPAISQTLDFLNQLYRDGSLSPDIFSKTEADKYDEFVQGRIAMMIGSIADIHTLRQRGINFGITTVPAPDTYFGKPGFGLSAWYVGIPQSGGHLEESWAFLSFLAEQSALLAEAAHGIPGNTIGPIDYLDADDLYSKAYNIYTAGEAAEEFTGLSPVDDFEAIIREELQTMFEMNRSGDLTAQTIQNRWETVLETAKPDL